MDDVKIERFDFSKGIEELLPLISTECPDGEMADPRSLTWEYLENPCGEPEMAVARSNSNEVIGQYVVIPLEYQIEGATLTGTLSLNTLTHPDFKGAGSVYVHGVGDILRVRGAWPRHDDRISEYGVLSWFRPKTRIHAHRER